jgi:hypothetical protein
MPWPGRPLQFRRGESNNAAALGKIDNDNDKYERANPKTLVLHGFILPLLHLCARLESYGSQTSNGRAAYVLC